LIWDIEEPCAKSNLLDLNTSSCFKGLIIGRLSQKKPDGFQKILTKFIDRLVKRGHTIIILDP